MEEYRLQCQPLANPESIISGSHYRFTILNEIVLRYEWSEDGLFEDRPSAFAINRRFPKPEFSTKESEDLLEIITPAFHLTYDKKRFAASGLVVICQAKVTEWGGEWRYGTRLFPDQNLGGTARTLDWVNGRCDMGHGIISRAGFESLDDSSSMLFPEGGYVAGRRPGDRIDGYLFCYGHGYKAAMKAFYAISGSQPTVPRWALGNWWSRYHAYSADEYLSLMDKFQAENVPLSVAVIDMDWHVTTGDDVPHVGWTGYTWNKKLFPEPEKFLKSLHDRDLKAPLSDHPHAGIHHHEDLYLETAQALGHDTSKKAPVLFDPADPKFMYAFLNTTHRALERQGCDFWWIDWQQGNFCRIPGVDPLWLLNHFQYLDCPRNPSSSEAIIFSRYAGPGSHRYPVGFSGDCVSTWESLQFQPEFTATASNIGYGWWSHDIGGHMKGYRDDELTARWVQLGVLSPLHRLHSTNSRWSSKEPWMYQPECDKTIRYFMRLRHRLVPYIYSIDTHGPDLGLPLIQPLYWNFPDEDEAYKYPNEYFFGPSMVISPIVKPRNKTTGYAHVKAWIPPRRHVDIMTGTIYDGDREIDLYRPLHQIPILAVEGAIIPLDAASLPQNGCLNPEAFEVFVIVGHDGQFTIVEDTQHDKSPSASNGQRLISIDYNQESGRLVTTSSGKHWLFRFVSLHARPSDIRVTVDGAVSSDAQISVDCSSGYASTTVAIRPQTSVNSVITIELGTTPQLGMTDHTKAISDMILRYQLELDSKDAIWKAVRSKRPVAVKVAALLSLDLDKEITGPAMELLLSDSRAEFGGCSE